MKTKLLPPQRHPDYQLFLLQLSILTTVDELAFMDWSRPRIQLLLDRFIASGEPKDELNAWLRIQYVRSFMGVSV